MGKVFETIFNDHRSKHCCQRHRLRNYTTFILFHSILYGFKTLLCYYPASVNAVRFVGPRTKHMWYLLWSNCPLWSLFRNAFLFWTSLNALFEHKYVFESLPCHYSSTGLTSPPVEWFARILTDTLNYFFGWTFLPLGVLFHWTVSSCWLKKDNGKKRISLFLQGVKNLYLQVPLRHGKDWTQRKEIVFHFF